MRNDNSIVCRCPLFDGIAPAELEALLGCLCAREGRYAKGEFVFLAGDIPDRVGIVLSGAVHVVQEDYWGNRNILAQAEEGELFAESFACAEPVSMGVSVLAVEKAEVLLLDYRRIFTTCSSACVFHARLIRNMLRILARKNIGMLEKMQHLTRRTTRDKVLSYLSTQAKRHNAGEFAIPFSRQELADYLAVERSALSAELSRMRDDGLIRYKKNIFELLAAHR
jgi:CRP-like cAMP-binding protein